MSGSSRGLFIETGDLVAPAIFFDAQSMPHHAAVLSAGAHLPSVFLP